MIDESKYSFETFNFCCGSKTIGCLTVFTSQPGDYVFEIDIVDDSNLPWAFIDRQGQFISIETNRELHRKIIKNWLEERVFPPERHDADEVLKDLGLTHYDFVAVLKYTKAKNRYDEFWVDFDSESKT